MDLFVIDTAGDTSGSRSFALGSIPRLPKSSISALDGRVPAEETKLHSTAPEESDDDDDDYAGLPPPGESIANILNKDDVADVHFVSRKRKSNGGGKAVSQTADDTAQQAGPSKQKKGGPGIQPIRTNVQEEMKSAVLTPAIEKKENIARLAMSDTAIRKLNRLERKKTKGKGWYGLAAPEITPELQNELTLMKMRSVLDPKQSFKRLDKRKQPKYFEIGKIIDSPLDHFNERGMKKLKSKSLVDELLADAEFQKYNKRKYAEALERQKKKAYHKAVMKMKKEKKKGKRK
ncbi:deoxynucleotidyltransferase terminal-interacting protein 2 [Anopheles gambiae]|uniref:deoxynucleotidyltransferase terminal-interacting protein 2 n=1 Tax=Anopheles gambiae TaxID=7165 RepID=UPI002AC90E6D|nr:deoxynucleotidyltransferase terminal-interacting protein 2 [Anopheles gambiae]